MSPRQIPELLAPAGNWDCIRAAVTNGADAVYFGLPRFNARLRADNFTEAELPEVVEFCHRRGVKTYVTFNTLVFTDELEDAANYLRVLNRANVDALIVQDVGLVRLAREITPELPIHASTQMTITSPEGVRFARELGIERVVLARELSLRELEKFGDELPLEVFVHGALCVAYSGQCLTSESLGQRSANRGECAQACRMPYELIVDGVVRDLGDKRYLLSPQDLAAVDEIPALVERGVVSFKIEGRLKSPEYVAAVTQVYRKAIDAALASAEDRETAITPADRYQLEMTFSRGLFTGWMHGVNHQQLVSARFGKKRGPFVGAITRVGKDWVEINTEKSLKPGDGIVFDTGGDTNHEQGGRIFKIQSRRIFFQPGHIDFTKLKPGDRVWKTDDPELNHRLRKTFAGAIAPRHREPVHLRVRGKAGTPLVLEAQYENHKASAISTMPLQPARTAPLTDEKLREHLGRLGETIYTLGSFDNALEGNVILPIGELNRLRREVVYQLGNLRQPTRIEYDKSVGEVFDAAQINRHSERSGDSRAVEESRINSLEINVTRETTRDSSTPLRSARNDGMEQPLSLAVLCRTVEQIEAALTAGITSIYADFEDIRRYKDAVSLVRRHHGRNTPDVEIFLATPRIQKAGERGFFKLIETAAPDGVLIRNLGAIEHFIGQAARLPGASNERQASRLPYKLIGDFSLNIANPLTAAHFKNKGLQRLTISYDLNISQVLALLAHAPPEWFELTIHQHMPMFHMEHCVFAAFMSKGTSFLDCGRPCEKHRVALRDRVGVEHPLRADVGCRNTLFNAVPQTGARFFCDLRAAGLCHYRIELLEENFSDAQKIISAYQALLEGRADGEHLWREMKAQSQLGVTRGTY